MTYQLAPRIALNVLHLSGLSGSVTNGNSCDFTTSANLVGTPTSTYNSSNGQITIPDKPCIALGSINFGTSTYVSALYVDAQWYDVNASQFIGTKGRLWGYRPDYYYASYTLTCDEEAKAIVQNTVIELRITGHYGSGMTLDTASQITHNVNSKSRAIIEEYG